MIESQSLFVIAGGPLRQRSCQAVAFWRRLVRGESEAIQIPIARPLIAALDCRVALLLAMTGEMAWCNKK